MLYEKQTNWQPVFELKISILLQGGFINLKLGMASEARGERSVDINSIADWKKLFDESHI